MKIAWEESSFASNCSWLDEIKWWQFLDAPQDKELVTNVKGWYYKYINSLKERRTRSGIREIRNLDSLSDSTMALISQKKSLLQNTIAEFKKGSDELAN